MNEFIPIFGPIKPDNIDPLSHTSVIVCKFEDFVEGYSIHHCCWLEQGIPPPHPE
jgi:hypothetical protein